MTEDIVYRYLRKRTGVDYMYYGTGFILYTIEPSDYNRAPCLCIYDVYSENSDKTTLTCLMQLENFYKRQGITMMETYCDKQGADAKRAKKVILEYGFIPFKEHEDYTYFYKRL